MLTRIPLTKNYSTTGQFDPENKKIVFIFYKRDPDSYAARKCAKILTVVSQVQD